MALNYPGPYQLRYEYSWNGLTHKGAINMDCLNSPIVGDLFTDITIQLKDGTNKQLSLVSVEYGTVFASLLNNTQAISGFEFWEYTPNTFDAKFISADPLTISGTGGTSPTDAWQTTYSFRSAEGGTAFITTLETSFTYKTQKNYVSLGVAEQALVDYVIATDSPVLARDTSYLYSFIRAGGGTNEKVYRKRFRQN